MRLYRAALAPAGPLASPLQSDTLFGAFCWSWLRSFGRASLEEEIIAPSLAGAPAVIFSNGFPAGTLPLPLGCYDQANRYEALPDKAQRQAAYQQGKRLKGARYIRRAAFEDIRAGDWRGFSQALAADAGQEETTIHNMVSRKSGRVENLGGAGSLFGADRRFFDPAQRFDCYILTGLERERLVPVVELMLSLGIGADKSTGCGVFRLEALEEEDGLPRPPEGANGFVALSNFIPARRDPTDGWYQTMPKYPKLDWELAAGDHPFKMPLLFLKAGSMFRAREPRPWYGRCLTGIAMAEVPVTVNGCTIALPVHIPDGV